MENIAGKNVTAGLELTYAALLSMAICLFAVPIAQRLKVIDFPDKGRKVHPGPTPLVGGIAIMAPLVLWCIVRIVSVDITNPNKLFVAIVLGGGAVAVTGLLDDQRHISAGARLLLLALVAGAALTIDPLLVGDHINTVSWGVVSIPMWLFAFLVILALVGYPSAVNMADGMNGIVVSLFFIWAACIAFTSTGSIAATARVIAVVTAVTFLFNLRGRLFLGDCGAFGVAFTLGLLTVADHNAGHLPVETVVVWYFIPVVDCFRQMLSRWIGGESPLKPDNNHFHHRLTRLFGPHAARFIYVGLVAVSSLASTFVPWLGPICVGLLALTYLVLLRPDFVGWHPRVAAPQMRPAKAPTLENQHPAIPTIGPQKLPLRPVVQDRETNRTLQ
jgi:UDP-GlcNAc:undecaprenyl-phosphate GlcNAc-1-phosphate transferase